jgi:hypothetical protein
MQRNFYQRTKSNTFISYLFQIEKALKERLYNSLKCYLILLVYVVKKKKKILFLCFFINVILTGEG